MNLENVFPHKRNTNVTVNGKIYRIGPGCFIEGEEGVPLDVPDEDAHKLLQGRAWRELTWNPTDPANKGRFLTAVDVAPGSRKGRPPRSMLQMETDYGAKFQNTKGELAKSVHPAAVHASEQARKDLKITADKGGPGDVEMARLAKADRARAAKSEKLGSKGATDPRGEVADTVAAAVYPGDAAIGDGRAPGQAATPTPPAAPSWEVPDDGDWPEPIIEMPLEYLHQMADAYEVKYNNRLGVEKLVKRIHDEMYPEIVE